MNAPPLTVLMAVHDGLRYLPEAVESILAQTFGDFEFLIIDDGSIEPVAERVLSYRDKRIRFLRQENRGLTRSLNRGISVAQGAYIARMDADDVCSPERLAVQMEAVRVDPKLDLVGSFFNVVDDNGELLDTADLIEDDVYRLWRLAFHNAYAHGSILFKKDAIVRAGVYDESLKYAQDYDLWWRISNQANTRMVPAALYGHRVRSDGLQASVRNYDAQFAATVAISNRNLRDIRPGSDDEDCSRMRSLYWKFERAAFERKATDLIIEALSGFCHRFGVEGVMRRKLESEVAADYRREMECSAA